MGFSEYSEYTDAYSRSDIEMMKNSKNKNLYKQSEPEQGTLLNIGATETKPKQEHKKPTNWYLLYLSGKITYHSTKQSCNEDFSKILGRAANTGSIIL